MKRLSALKSIDAEESQTDVIEDVPPEMGDSSDDEDIHKLLDEKLGIEEDESESDGEDADEEWWTMRGRRKVRVEGK